MKNKAVIILLVVIIGLICANIVYMYHIDKKIPTDYYLGRSRLIKLGDNEEKTGIEFTLYSSNKKQNYLGYYDVIHLKCYDKEDKYLTSIEISCATNEYNNSSVCQSEKKNKGFSVNSSAGNVFYSEGNIPEGFVENYSYCELDSVY